MEYTLSHLGKNDKVENCKCSLYINYPNFRVFFHETTPEILLGDKNYYSVNELQGVAYEMDLSKRYIKLKCFVEIYGKIHKEELLFRFAH